MKRQFFGDSYDFTKREIIKLLKGLCYDVYYDLKFLEDAKELDKKGEKEWKEYFLDFIGIAKKNRIRCGMTKRTNEFECGCIEETFFEGDKVKAIFLDPHTGIYMTTRKSRYTHIMVEELSFYFKKGFDLLVIFDQGFSRALKKKDIKEVMMRKMEEIKKMDAGISSFYYHHHQNAAFLFIVKNERVKDKIISAMMDVWKIPEEISVERIIQY